jgi:hypothetical protein
MISRVARSSRQVLPALGGGAVGDVADHTQARCGCGEIASDEVRGGCGLWSAQVGLRRPVRRLCPAIRYSCIRRGR